MGFAPRVTRDRTKKQSSSAAARDLAEGAGPEIIAAALDRVDPTSIFLT